MKRVQRRRLLGTAVFLVFLASVWLLFPTPDDRNFSGEAHGPDFLPMIRTPGHPGGTGDFGEDAHGPPESALGSRRSSGPNGQEEGTDPEPDPSSISGELGTREDEACVGGVIVGFPPCLSPHRAALLEQARARVQSRSSSYARHPE